MGTIKEGPYFRFFRLLDRFKGNFLIFKAEFVLKIDNNYQINKN